MDTGFTFDADTHTYTYKGVPIPHVTGLLQRAGLVDARWFTEEARDRGTAVHTATAQVDYGTLVDLKTWDSPVKGWVHAYVAAVTALRPIWRQIEVAMVHPAYPFGGRPDRIGLVDGLLTIVDLKSGGMCPSHPIQTALQAILAEPVTHLPPQYVKRATLYLTGSGRFRWASHDSQRDLSEARTILKEFC